MPDALTEKLYQLSERGEPFALAIVVRTEGATSAKPGCKAIVESDGTVFGWVGGGCTQSVVVEHALEALRYGKPRLVSVGPSGQSETREGVIRAVTDCASEGVMDIYIEPYLPKPQLLIIGHVPVSGALAKLGKFLNFTVTVVSPLATREMFPDADRVLNELDQAEAGITPQTYLVVATHQAYPGKPDEEVLEWAINTEAPYVALVASRKRASAVLRYLLERGLPVERLRKVRSPAGLALGFSLRPEEIALSIVAEIVSIRRSGTGKSIPNVEIPEAIPRPLKRTRAKDPVCGMMVAMKNAIYISTYNERTYYFCSEHCKSSFDENPARYVK